jgi:transposase
VGRAWRCGDEDVEAFRIGSDQAHRSIEDLDVDHSTCASSALWCPRADLLFDVPGMHVLTVERQPERVVLTIESDADVGGCPQCGVVAVGHGRRRRVVADAPCFGIPVRLVWLARLWCCREPDCPIKVFTEQHDLVPPRAKLTSRAARWATDALTVDDTTVSALARHLGVDWHTCWDAVEAEATRRLGDPARLVGVEVLGVDEHIWRPSRVGDAQRAVTGMVDLTRDPHGQLHARLLDVVPGRTGTAYAGWLKDQDSAFVSGVKHASLDPFRAYNWLRQCDPRRTARRGRRPRRVPRRPGAP